ncbi:hypothetical protein [Nocardia sp. NPDC023988]|uniref:DUF7373 family lipoprotein n=1 Tax=unclassified Nocardia TaxID=2637762 RepID=UPI0033D2074C
MRLNVRLFAAVVAVGTVVTACGSDTVVQPVPTVDLNQLDTGNYQSTPRDPGVARADDTGEALEAIRLGAAVPLPYDVDPSYGFQRLNTPQVRTTSKIRGSMTKIDEEAFPEVTKGLIVGWKTSGERRIQPFLGRQAWIYVYRFGTADEAATAARQISEKQQEKNPGSSVEIPGFPGARSNWAGYAVDSWLSQDAMVYGVRLEDPMTEPPDAIAAIEFIKKAYIKIDEMLDSYTPTPEEKMAELLIDTDEMLSRTLPSSRDNWVGPLPEGAVEPAQASLIRDKRPGTTKPAFIDAGVDLVSNEGSVARVYRAKDSDAAQRLLIALTEPQTDVLKAVEGPRSLPGAKCFDRRDPKASATSHPPVCYVTFDRYLARTTSYNIQDLYQRTAAQYRLLAVGRER